MLPPVCTPFFEVVVSATTSNTMGDELQSVKEGACHRILAKPNHEDNDNDDAIHSVYTYLYIFYYEYYIDII
jgi:hypothetical protein